MPPNIHLDSHNKKQMERKDNPYSESCLSEAWMHSRDSVYKTQEHPQGTRKLNRSRPRKEIAIDGIQGDTSLSKVSTKHQPEKKKKKRITGVYKVNTTLDGTGSW